MTKLLEKITKQYTKKSEDKLIESVRVEKVSIHAEILRRMMTQRRVNSMNEELGKE